MTNRFSIAVAFALIAVSSVGWAGSRASISEKDRQQILDLVSQYSYTYDAKDLEAFLSLFTKDCLWEAFAGSEQKQIAKAASRDELRAVVTQRLAMLRQKGIQSRHYQTNTVLTRRADGQVEGTTMLNLTWQVPGEKPVIAMTGIYRDLFVKTEAGWRFIKRSAFVDQANVGG